EIRKYALSQGLEERPGGMLAGFILSLVASLRSGAVETEAHLPPKGARTAAPHTGKPISAAKRRRKGQRQQIPGPFLPFPFCGFCAFSRLTWFFLLWPFHRNQAVVPVFAWEMDHACCFQRLLRPAQKMRGELKFGMAQAGISRMLRTMKPSMNWP